MKTAATATLPCAYHGTIQVPGEIDYIRFKGTKGQTLSIACYARRLGSPLDPVMPGVEAHANILENIIFDNQLKYPNYARAVELIAAKARRRIELLSQRVAATPALALSLLPKLRFMLPSKAKGERRDTDGQGFAPS